MSEEEKYCNSDWVAYVKSLRRGEVRDKEGKASEYEYTVKLLKTFKDNKTCNQNNKIDCIYSATNSAACGVELKDSQEYLLFGRYDNDGKRKISVCGYNREWEKDDKDCEYTKNNYVFTSANDGICGYYYSNGRRSIGLCGYNKEWNLVPKEVKKDLNNGAFDDYCKLKTTNIPKI
uniref:NTR domain-containing protein n=1 Tax=Meloidogyne floridensis TaxID=298350 RepID=A0A915PD83_9BILA